MLDKEEMRKDSLACERAFNACNARFHEERLPRIAERNDSVRKAMAHIEKAERLFWRAYVEIWNNAG